MTKDNKISKQPIEAPAGEQKIPLFYYAIFIMFGIYFLFELLNWFLQSV